MGTRTITLVALIVVAAGSAFAQSGDVSGTWSGVSTSTICTNSLTETPDSVTPGETHCESHTDSVTGDINARGKRLTVSAGGVAFIEGTLLSRTRSVATFAVNVIPGDSCEENPRAPTSCDCWPSLLAGTLRVDTSNNTALGTFTGVNSDCLVEMNRVSLEKRR